MTIPGVGAVTALALVAVMATSRAFRPAPSGRLSGPGPAGPPVRGEGRPPRPHLPRRPGARPRPVIEAAHTAIRTPGPLRAFHARIAARRGQQIALCATARKLAVLTWHLLSKDEDYRYGAPTITQRKLRNLQRKADDAGPRSASPARPRARSSSGASSRRPSATTGIRHAKASRGAGAANGDTTPMALEGQTMRGRLCSPRRLLFSFGVTRARRILHPALDVFIRIRGSRYLMTGCSAGRALLIERARGGRAHRRTADPSSRAAAGATSNGLGRVGSVVCGRGPHHPPARARRRPRLVRRRARGRPGGPSARRAGAPRCHAAARPRGAGRPVGDERRRAGAPAVVPGGLDQKPPGVELPALVIEPCRRRSPVEDSDGTRPRKLASCLGCAKAVKSPTSATESDRGQRVDAAQAAQSADQRLRGFKMPVHAAARWYSWMSPPSRSWRLIW